MTGFIFHNISGRALSWDLLLCPDSDSQSKKSGVLMIMNETAQVGKSSELSLGLQSQPVLIISPNNPSSFYLFLNLKSSQTLTHTFSLRRASTLSVTLSLIITYLTCMHILFSYYCYMKRELYKSGSPEWGHSLCLSVNLILSPFGRTTASLPASCGHMTIKLLPL